jgi:hypothetical protein
MSVAVCQLLVFEICFLGEPGVGFESSCYTRLAGGEGYIRASRAVIIFRRRICCFKWRLSCQASLALFVLSLLCFYLVFSVSESSLELVALRRLTGRQQGRVLYFLQLHLRSHTREFT